jgi:hypothetical protein
MSETLFLLFFWSGPIGLCIGLALIGTFALLLAKVNEINKRTKAFEKEKGLEKKRGSLFYSATCWFLSGHS